MVEIEFSNHFFVKQKITFFAHVAVLLGKHCSGKTTILETLYKGLQGKDAHFFVNGQKNGPGDFQVIYLKDHFELKEEIKLNKNSPFRNHILKTINHNILAQEKYQQVTTDIKNLALAIEKVVTELFADNLKALTNDDIILKFGVDKINLEHIIDQLLAIDLFDQKKEQFLDESHFNRFLLRMVIFNVLKSSLDNDDQQRPIFVLFDNPELYTSLTTIHQLNTILKTLSKKNNFYLVLASNSIDYLTDFAPHLESLNYLNQNSVQLLYQPQEILKCGIASYGFLTNDQYQDWFWYQNDFAHIFDQNDLEVELKKFYKINYGYFFRAFFVDKIIFSTIKKNQSSYFYLNTEPESLKQVVNYYLNISDIFLLAYFFKSLHFDLQFDIQYPKNDHKTSLVLQKLTEKT